MKQVSGFNEETFVDPLTGLSLRHISPKQIKASYLGNLWWMVLFIVGAVALVVWGVLQTHWWTYPLAALLVVLVVLEVWLIPRRIKVTGYAIREDDLVIASGRLFRNVVMIPFGRIQTVSISDGPITRKYDLSSVSIEVAGGSSSTIFGLPADKAPEVRTALQKKTAELMADF